MGMPDEKPAASAAPEGEGNEQERDEETVPPKTGDEKPVEEEKPERSPYQDDLDRIEAERLALEERHEAELKAKDEERQRLMRIKDEAITKEKNKTRDVKDEWKNELRDELRREREMEKAQERINASTDDPAARKVILHHYQNTIRTTGNVEEDILAAIAVANRHRVSSILNVESSEDMADRKSISSMGGDGSSTRDSFKMSPSAAARTAGALARAFAGRDKDKANKLAERAASRLR